VASIQRPTPADVGTDGVASAEVADDAVRLRFLVARGLPLVVAEVRPVGRGTELTAALAQHGLRVLPGFLGVELPKGAQVGFVLEGSELRLVDERDETLLRAPRGGIDDAWLAAARRLRGTMTVVVDRLDVDGDVDAATMAAAVEARARQGAAIGAIVGVVEQRPSLPLLF
jgi:hypothetical protein